MAYCIEAAVYDWRFISCLGLPYGIYYFTMDLKLIARTKTKECLDKLNVKKSIRSLQIPWGIRDQTKYLHR
jgi:hypothetical protein